VTVTGPGGVGKTRLAGEVLRQVAGRFADGVLVVELAAVTDPALVPAMVATVLGLHQAPGVPIMDALAARLARPQLLLVLDNCEHVLDAVAQFCATILLSADDIRILATSREPLGLPEEARYRLPSLALPGPADPGAGLEAQAEAVTLFVERAVSSTPASHWTPRRARSWAGWCSGWMGCRSPSNWPPPGSRRSRPARTGGPATGCWRPCAGSACASSNRRGRGGRPRPR
jgi:predicted ATPase